MAKRKQPRNGSDDNAVRGKRASQTGNLVMTSAIASAFVSVGLWIAEDFYHLNIPAHLAPPLATIVVFLAGVGRIVAVGIVGLVVAFFNAITGG
jgi:hypothetical protein